MAESKIQPSRQRRAFNGWCHGLFAGQHFEHVLNLGCGHDVDRQGYTYSGYVDAKKVTRLDFAAQTTYPAHEVSVCGGDCFNNPVDVLSQAESLPFPDGMFDMVFCNWVIYHTDYVKTLNEIGRVLVGQGKLFVSYNATEQLGPIYQAVTDRFAVIGYSLLQMDRELDGRNGVAESIWGAKKEECYA